jgi:hypothetical protein
LEFTTKLGVDCAGIAATPTHSTSEAAAEAQIPCHGYRFSLNGIEGQDRWITKQRAKSNMVESSGRYFRAVRKVISRRHKKA